MSFNLLTIERDHLQVSFSLYEHVNLESLFWVHKNTLSKGNNNNNISVRSPLLAEAEKSQTQQKREKNHTLQKNLLFTLWRLITSKL